MDATPIIKVAGAGALGLTCALALADRGARVTVHDPAGPGDNASSVAAGMLAPAFEAVLDPQATPHLAALMAGRDLWPGLAERIGVPLDRRGALGVGESAWLAEAEARLRNLGLASARTGRTDDLAPGVTGREGLLVADDWRLDSLGAMVALRRACMAAGVSFRSEPVAERGNADLLLAATGEASGLAPELALLQPIKGHILRLAGPPYGGLTVRAKGIYAAPAADGLILGATMEPGLSDRTVDPAQTARLLQAGLALFPGWSQAPVNAQTGVRAETPDGLPLAGFSRSPGVLVAAGARRNGWLLAPLVAQVVAALVFERDAGPYATAFNPGRFA